jgi:AraC-like DNA-binding protein
MIPSPDRSVYQEISLHESKMNLHWVDVSLLPSNPYSIREASRKLVMGFAFERQVGVHAIGGDNRLDFDAWPGELVVTQAGVEIFSESVEGGEYLTLHIGVSEELEALQEVFRHPRTVIPGNRQAFMASMKLRRLMLSRRAQRIEIEEQVAHLVNVSLTQVTRTPSTTGSARSERLAHARVLDYIEANLCGSLSLDDLAQISGMPKLHFLRSFTCAIGTTPHKFITERRLQHARSLLAHTDAAIAFIACECGFAHQSHLGSLLNSQLGLSPGQYRKALP